MMLGRAMSAFPISETGPDDIADTQSAEDSHDDVDDLIGDDRSLAEEIGGAAVPVVAPSQNRRIGKAHHADDEHRCADVGNSGKGGIRQIGASLQRTVHDDVGMGEHRRDEDESVIRHITTVDQKVPVEAMSAWRAGLRVLAAAATMGAVPRPDSLENSPRAHPYCKAIHDAAAHRAAERRLARERTFEYERKRLAQVRGVRDEDDEAAYRVGRSHEGNEPLADARDGLDTTEYDHGDEHCDDERYGPLWNHGEVSAYDARHRR